MRSHKKGLAISLVIGFLIGASVTFVVKPAGTASHAITSSGSTTVLPLSIEWATRISGFYPELIFSPTGGGSGKGQSDAATGLVDIGASSSIPSPTWRSDHPNIYILPICADGLGVIVNTHVNATMKMDCDVVVAIFNRNITTWENLETTFHVSVQASGPINVYVRSDSSGTTATFTKWLQTANKTANPYANYTWGRGSSEAMNWPAGANAVEGNPGVASGVKGDQNGIGYVGLAFMEGLVPVSLYNPSIGRYIEPSEENTLKALPPVIADAGVNLFNSGSSGAYPICRLLFYLINSDILMWYTIAFLNWCLTQGQAFVSGVGYVSIAGTSAAAYANGLLSQMVPA